MRNELPSILAGLFSAGLSTGKQVEIVNRTAQVGVESFDYQVHIPPQTENIENLPVIVDYLLFRTNQNF